MLTYWIYRGIAALPLRTSYGLARVFAWLTEFVFRYRIKTVDSNLRNAFPDKPEAWYVQTRHAFYQQLADVAVEALYAWRIPKEELEHRMTLKGWEPLMSEEGTPAPGIILALHHTNWEWLTQRASLAARAPFDGVYKPLHDPGADRFALESRGKFGGTLVTMKSIGKHVLKARRASRVLALLADQSPGKKEAVYWTDFLNQPTAFFMGPATLARLTRYPVYFARTRRISRGRYEAELLELCATPGSMSENELIERYAQMSEEAIRLQPESYLWSNRRWKLKPPQATRETSPDDSDVVQPNP